MGKHGMSKTTIYKRWASMKQRCNNVNSIGYKNYGGRGIKVCSDWNDSFLNFYEWAINNGFKKELEIDRINNDGNYEPLNCQFITKKENMSSAKKRQYKGCRTTGVVTSKGKFKAHVFINGKRIDIGVYDTEYIAEKEREKYLKENQNNICRGKYGLKWCQ